MQIDPRLPEIDDCLYRLAVRAFIFHDGKVLLTHESDADRWSFPGGGLNYGEDIAHALPRELAEELGVPVSEIKTNFQIVHVTTGSAVDGVPRANLFYRVDVPKDLVRAVDEISELDWFRPSDITAHTVSLYVDPSTEAASEFISAIENQAASVL